MLDDSQIAVVKQELLQEIKEHCVIFLYSFASSLDKEDIKGTDLFTQSEYISEKDFDEWKNEHPEKGPKDIDSEEERMADFRSKVKPMHLSDRLLGTLHRK